MDIKLNLYKSLLFLSACILTVGCGSSGPPLGQVHGKITLDGQPIDGAKVEFIPSEGRPSYGVTDASGVYELQFTNDSSGAMLGSHKVVITTVRDAASNEGAGPDVEARKELLPVDYHMNTQLKADVVSGDNTFDFDLSSKGNDA